MNSDHFFSKEDLETLVKYKKGAIVEEKDKRTLEKVRFLGLLKTGITENSQGEFCETARLNGYGNSIINRELILRHPIKRFFYNIYAFCGPPYHL